MISSYEAPTRLQDKPIAKPGREARSPKLLRADLETKALPPSQSWEPAQCLARGLSLLCRQGHVEHPACLDQTAGPCWGHFSTPCILPYHLLCLSAGLGLSPSEVLAPAVLWAGGGGEKLYLSPPTCWRAL